MVHILYGSAAGLTDIDNQLWHEDLGDIQDSAQQYDAFGWALASGDFDGDGYGDLAVGVPGQVAGEADYAGGVHLLNGASGGLTAYGDRLLTQADLGFTPQYSENFGRALAAADFNGDGYADLAVGVPSEDFVGGSPARVGSVNTLYGSNAGLSADGVGAVYQGFGLEDMPEQDDHFGVVLAAGDLNGDGFADLAVGIPDEDLDLGSGVEEDAGAVHVLYGAIRGLELAGNQFWHQGSPIFGIAEADDRFGSALAVLPWMGHAVYLPLVARNYH